MQEEIRAYVTDKGRLFVTDQDHTLILNDEGYVKRNDCNGPFLSWFIRRDSEGTYKALSRAYGGDEIYPVGSEFVVRANPLNSGIYDNEVVETLRNKDSVHRISQARVWSVNATILDLKRFITEEE